ncbi:hypothetical protein BJ165DRAFT_1531503 [Panaeolus papilionaceus]|nr:hypothetical protein BJ165DRAFT_1531503 [Panaeolus papilionaceus]
MKSNQSASPNPFPHYASASSGAGREPVTPSKGKKPTVQFRNFANTTLVFDQESETVSSPRLSPTPQSTVGVELQALRDEITSLHSAIRTLTHQNATLCAQHEETMRLMREIQASVGHLTPRGVAGAALGSNNPRVHAHPPDFKPRSRAFYTIIKGRCPGIYTDLDWARFLVQDLGINGSQWKSYPTYAAALDAFMAGLERDVVEVTGRSPNDDHIYGPRTYFIPYMTVEEYNGHVHGH